VIGSVVKGMQTSFLRLHFSSLTKCIQKHIMYAWRSKSIPYFEYAERPITSSDALRLCLTKVWCRRLIDLPARNGHVSRKQSKRALLYTSSRKQGHEVNRSHVIRLNPTPEQEVYFRKACGVARHTYNWALARWKDYRREGKWVSMTELRTEYNCIKGEQFPWVYEVTKCATEQAFAYLGQAFANYWRMKKEGTLPKLKYPRKDGEQGGFPRFKSKKRDRLSFYIANDKFSVAGHMLRVPKLGDVNMVEELRFAGKIMSAVISYRAGWWFVSISVEMEHEAPTHSGGTVGVDLGIKTLATLSDGTVFENQKHYRQGMGRIKGLSKGLSRKVEGSQNWWKNTRKLAKAHYRVACQRQDTLHKMTTYLARTYALIGLEDLNTKGMLANHRLAQAVSDASFFEVKRQLLYKAEQNGGYVQLVSRWFPSSKTCHVCGWMKEDLTLKHRVWTCEQCGTVHERDLNAARTTEAEALRLVRDVPVVASSGQQFACGAESSGSLCGESATFCNEAGTKVS
jgi:putative transposase